MPAALTEIGYISNPLECAELSDPSFRQSVARGIANGIVRHFEGKGVVFIARCPVDLIVTDPDGLRISKEFNEIPGASYLEVDINGAPGVQIRIPDRKIGAYIIDVIPKPDALPTDTFTLELSLFGASMIIARNVQISDIPAEPYVVISTETGIIPPIIPATIDFDSDTLNLKSKGKFVTVYIEIPPGYDVSQIDISSIRLNGTVPALAKPTQIGDYDKDSVADLMVKFDRAAVKGLLTPGSQVEITVTGEVAGIAFEGSDTIRVISK